MIKQFITANRFFLKGYFKEKAEAISSSISTKNTNSLKQSRLSAALEGKRILITGGSSGIGLACATSAFANGASVIIVGRDQEKLSQAVQAVESSPGKGQIHYEVCDIANLDDCDLLVQKVLNKHGPLDILFNNAGRSIRRSIAKSFDRFHDIQRTMQLNYFGGTRLITGFLPSMLDNGGGQIIHSSTMGTMAPTPRFGAYLASKAAMDAFLDALVAEFSDRGIVTTAIKFPLVKTPMIAPTKEYADAPAANPATAARMFESAIVQKPRRVVTGTGKKMGFLTLYAPEFMTKLYNYWYRIWPDGKGDFPELDNDRKEVKRLIKQSPL